MFKKNLANKETIRKIFLISSIIIFAISLYCPTFCTNKSCSEIGSGFNDLTFGWIGALLFRSANLVWFANPFFFIALITNKKKPILSLICSTLALFIALFFLKGGTVVLNEAGHKEYITKIQIGYWLWISSMFILIIASIIPILGIFKKSDNQSDSNFYKSNFL